MRVEKISIDSGDFGKKFLVKHNREIDARRSRRMASSWETIRENTFIVLTPIDEDSYHIIDGQHRLYCASEFLDSSTTINAIIRDDLSSSDLIKGVTTLNLGTRFRLKDHLAVNKDESFWPVYPHEFNKDLTFTERTATLNWSNLMRARAMVDHIKTSGALSHKSISSKEILYNIWLNSNYSRVDMERTFQALHWFLGPINNHSIQNAQKRQAYTSKSICMAILAYEQNKHLIRGNEPVNMLNSGAFQEMAHMAGRSMTVYGNVWMRAINYKKRYTLKVFGMDGR